MTESGLDVLVGEQLESVVFVRDYLQLDFGDARFTAYVWPAVTVGNTVLEFGEPGYRDALCAFISQESHRRIGVTRMWSGDPLRLG